MRLDQFLVKSNICSRSEAKQLIKKGRVSVDGNIWTDSSAHLDENTAVVRLDGEEISYSKNHYYMLNKPEGCVSATRDGLSTTVLEYLSGEPTKGLFPVGRLDKDTEGLLLIMDDGKLAHELLSPRHHVDKTYLVKSDRVLTDIQMKQMEEGIDIGDDKLTLPATITDVCSDYEEGNWYKLVIHEGRFHQVKRMFEYFGATVIYLKRLSMGKLMLDDKLKPGEYRSLSEQEIELLRK